MTSIEWLLSELEKINYRPTEGIIMYAKFIHKLEIIDAFDEGQEREYQYHINSAPKFDSETYYQETFENNHIVDTNEIKKKMATNCSQPVKDNHALEISDEEIENEAKEWALGELITSRDSFVLGAKWYREKLKKRR
jgi:hypothetical protein